MGDISIREHIRWLPDPPSEPTLTVVLTSPERRFVDIRVLRDAQPLLDGTHPHSALDWAIAGTSSSIPKITTDGEQFSHSRWTHWIDSRTADVANAADEGDNFTQPDGSILEKGRMIYPPTGRETDYEEVWRSEPAQTVPSPFGDASGAVCVVLRLGEDDDASQTRRGMVVRLGHYCQAIVRKGDSARDVTAERWAWDGEWARKVKIGTAGTPTDFAIHFGHEATVGDEVKVGGDVWTVVESGTV